MLSCQAKDLGGVAFVHCISFSFLNIYQSLFVVTCIVKTTVISEGCQQAFCRLSRHLVVLHAAVWTSRMNPFFV